MNDNSLQLTLTIHVPNDMHALCILDKYHAYSHTGKKIQTVFPQNHFKIEHVYYTIYAIVPYWTVLELLELHCKNYTVKNKE